MAVTETYYDEGRVGVLHDGDIAVALEAAQTHSANGFIPTAHWVVQERLRHDKNHWCWEPIDTITQEYACIDTEGKFVDKGEGLVAIVHGGNLITPERIRTAKVEQKLVNGALPLEQEEVIQYLTRFSRNRMLYHINEIINLGTLPHNPKPIAIILPLKIVKTMKSGLYTRDEFVNNQLVIARTLATKEEREAYFNKASYENQLGNWHRFGEINLRQAQGRLLFLGDSCYGLSGNVSLNSSGRFVGVAPEAPQRALEWIAKQQRIQEESQRIREQSRERARTIQLPTFVQGEGYVVAPQNVPKPLPQKQRPEEAFINAVRAEVKEQYPNLTATQQEARADIVTRFKNLELD